MLAIRNVSRYKAASVHLVISATIAAIALAVMLFGWYPPPLFTAMGGAELALLIVGIDVAIGPLITLIIFDPRKKELAFDLTIIAVIQMAALAYGMYAMHSGRPVFTVFDGQKLAVVSAAELDPNDLAQGRREEFRTLSLTGPRLVAVEPPTDADELSNIAFGALGGMGIQHLPKYYVPYAEKRSVVLAAAHTLDEFDLSNEDEKRLQQFLDRSGRKVTELRCLPVTTSRAMMTGIIDAGSGSFLAILDVQPVLRRPHI